MIRELPQISAADVIEQRWYRPVDIEDLLGISAGTIEKAKAGNEFNEMTGDGSIHGSDVLAWINRREIRYEPTALARRLVQRQREVERAQAALRPTGNELRAKDVIHTGSWYTIDLIENLLVIDRNAVNEGIRTNRLKSRQTTAGPEILGAQLLSWLMDYQIAYKVSEPTEAPASGRPEDAFDLVRKRRVDDARFEAESTGQSWRLYVSLLMRNNLSQLETSELANIISDLGISEAQFNEDRDRVQSARRNQEWHEDVDNAREKMQAATADLKELEERQKRERDEAIRKKSHATSYHNQCRNAESRLTNLKKERPQLFEPNGLKLLAVLAK